MGIFSTMMEAGKSMRRFNDKYKKLLYGVVALEAGFLLGCYAVHHKLNHSQDFRYWMSQKAPWILEGFYKMGEKTIEDYNARELDLIEFKKKDENAGKESVNTSQSSAAKSAYNHVSSTNASPSLSAVTSGPSTVLQTTRP